MGALAERERKARPKPRQKCAVLKALDVLDQEDGDALLRLLYKRLDLSAGQVSEVLAPEVVLSERVIRAHRSHDCEACRKG